jgi:hypothetical protein
MVRHFRLIAAVAHHRQDEPALVNSTQFDCLRTIAGKVGCIARIWLRVRQLVGARILIMRIPNYADTDVHIMRMSTIGE